MVTLTKNEIGLQGNDIHLIFNNKEFDIHLILNSKELDILITRMPVEIYKKMFDINDTIKKSKDTDNYFDELFTMHKFEIDESDELSNSFYKLINKMIDEKDLITKQDLMGLSSGETRRQATIFRNEKYAVKSNLSEEEESLRQLIVNYQLNSYEFKEKIENELQERSKKITLLPTITDSVTKINLTNELEEQKQRFYKYGVGDKIIELTVLKIVKDEEEQGTIIPFESRKK